MSAFQFSCQEEADTWIDMVFQSSHNGKIDGISYYVVKHLKSYNPQTHKKTYLYECVVEFKDLEFTTWVVESLEEALAAIKDEIYAFEALASLDY